MDGIGPPWQFDAAQDCADVIPRLRRNSGACNRSKVSGSIRQRGLSLDAPESNALPSPLSDLG